VQVFGRGQRRAFDTLGRLASEKRQSTKSRGVEAPSVPLVIWGFSLGGSLGEVGLPALITLPRRMGASDGLKQRNGGTGEKRKRHVGERGASGLAPYRGQCGGGPQKTAFSETKTPGEATEFPAHPSTSGL
jgi:hypothetical protein